MKNIVKSLFLPLLASRPVTALATRWLGHGVPVFMLHRMHTDAFPNPGGIRPDHLRRTLQYLVDNGYTFISLEHLLNALASRAPLPRRAAVFTLDDGYLDQAEVAAPVFLEFDCPATFFVITGMLDGTLWPWDSQVSWILQTTERTALETVINGQPLMLDLGSAGRRREAKHQVQDLIREAPAGQVPAMIEQFARDAGVAIPAAPPERFRPMTWDMARQLEARGIRFAPHSVSHAILSRLGAESLESEIRDSWQALERELERPARIFCYPTGRASDFGPREIAALERHGFLGAVSAIPALVDATDGSAQRRFGLPRLSLPESMADFIQCCSWIGYSRLNRGRRSDVRRREHDRARIARGTT